MLFTSSSFQVSMTLTIQVLAMLEILVRAQTFNIWGELSSLSCDRCILTIFMVFLLHINCPVLFIVFPILSTPVVFLKVNLKYLSARTEWCWYKLTYWCCVFPAFQKFAGQQYLQWNIWSSGDLSEVCALKGFCGTVLDFSKTNLIPALIKQVKECAKSLTDAREWPVVGWPLKKEE